MRIAALLVCLAYWGLLTALLLTPHPASLVGMQSVPIFPWGKFGVHLIAFIGLSVMVHTASWPKRPTWYMLLVLVIYALTTETLQRFVQCRSSRLMDAFENLLGIAIGTGLYYVILRWMQPFLKLNLAARLVKLGCTANNESVAE